MTQGNLCTLSKDGFCCNQCMHYYVEDIWHFAILHSQLGCSYMKWIEVPQNFFFFPFFHSIWGADMLYQLHQNIIIILWSSMKSTIKKISFLLTFNQHGFFYLLTPDIWCDLTCVFLFYKLWVQAMHFSIKWDGNGGFRQ